MPFFCNFIFTDTSPYRNKLYSPTFDLFIQILPCSVTFSFRFHGSVHILRIAEILRPVKQPTWRMLCCKSPVYWFPVFSVSVGSDGGSVLVFWISAHVWLTQSFHDASYKYAPSARRGSLTSGLFFCTLSSWQRLFLLRLLWCGSVQGYYVLASQPWSLLCWDMMQVSSPFWLFYVEFRWRNKSMHLFSVDYSRVCLFSSRLRH